MDGFERITGREHDGLVEKCQENGWLKVGGFDWQDDPFLEEYPYEFSRTDSVDRLREALGSGNWAIRQGFCYRDLAFIQQVDGGGEWAHLHEKAPEPLAQRAASAREASRAHAGQEARAPMARERAVGAE